MIHRRAMMAGLFLLATHGRADVLALTWDNDLFFRMDANYTNGVRLSWLGEERLKSCPRCAAIRVADKLSFLPGVGREDAHYAIGINVEQLMMTPQDISLSTPQYNDIPYAGVLLADMGLYARTKDSVTAYRLVVGTTGPDSGAEQTQKMVHRWTLSEPPRGWQNQLPGKPIAGVAAVHARLLHNAAHGSLTRQAGFAVGGRADGWMGKLSAGVFARIGDNLPGNILPDYAGNGSSASLAGLGPVDGNGWSLFAGLSSDAIGWNYLEYEGRRAGYNVETEDLVGAGIIGGSLQRGRFTTVMSFYHSTSYTRSSNRFISFGTVAFLWQY